MSSLPETMRALVKDGGSVEVRRVPSPRPRADEVVIEVALAGLCRTDVYVARGRIPSPDPLVLGHEFAGVVSAFGDEVQGFGEGDRVGVMPIIPCGRCGWCVAGRTLWCQDTVMLGVDLDGAFAERIAVPARAVYPLPKRMGWRMAAYLEPIAASMAVLDAPIEPGEKGLILGDSRIATLTQRVMLATGFGCVPVCELERADQLESDSYQFVIETCATDDAIAQISRVLRPGGVLVLKSRAPWNVSFDPRAFLRKELTMKATHYRDYARAIELADTGCLHVEDLLGAEHPLEAFDAVFAAAGDGGPTKQFFVPWRGG